MQPASNGSVAGAAGAPAVGSTTPSSAIKTWPDYHNLAEQNLAEPLWPNYQQPIQCPIKHPFPKFGEGTNTIEVCCKCISQTKCQAADGANYPNMDGVEAMLANNDIVDKSKFFVI